MDNNENKIAPHHQRMLDEQTELTEKTIKLKEFIDYNPMFQKLDVEEQLDMRTQYYFMVKYSNVLQSRIDRAGL